MRLVGIDISPAMVAEARKDIESSGLRRSIQIREGSADRIPFPGNIFYIVVSTAAIHHWKDPVTGLNEVYRVLNDERYALMYDVVSDTPAHILEQLRRQFGRLRTAFFWIRAFEEPFYGLTHLQRLAGGTLFGGMRYDSLACSVA